MKPFEDSIYQDINNITEISDKQEPILIQYFLRPLLVAFTY